LANLRELEYAQKKGQLVPIVLVNAFVGGMIVAARERLMRMPGELRDQLAACIEPIACERMLEREVRLVLAELKEMEVERVILADIGESIEVIDQIPASETKA
jgi:hypothetical protein